MSTRCRCGSKGEGRSSLCSYQRRTFWKRTILNNWIKRKDTKSSFLMRKIEWSPSLRFSSDSCDPVRNMVSAYLTKLKWAITVFFHRVRIENLNNWQLWPPLGANRSLSCAGKSRIAQFQLVTFTLVGTAVRRYVGWDSRRHSPRPTKKNIYSRICPKWETIQITRGAKFPWQQFQKADLFV